MRVLPKLQNPHFVVNCRLYKINAENSSQDDDATAAAAEQESHEHMAKALAFLVSNVELWNEVQVRLQ